ncbi:type II toxin-antitoxin system VapC family toxin [Metallococcus carri]|uniref:type II toxin-antitoxin system VapC family toxin n=1 Tax=Metallococcus carri TaxID=1656884 RepID=UPI002E2B978B|nr:type II toxin-antitoxin system VapC family toxin [Metallococcus carri]
MVDASAMVDALAGAAPEAALLAALRDEDLCAPFLLDVEVVSALRGLSLAGKVGPAVAEDALTTYRSFTIDRYPTEPLLQRIWWLRHRYTAYDASYLALAEALGAELWTRDVKLDSGGHAAAVRVVGASPE